MFVRFEVRIALLVLGDTAFGFTPYLAQDGWTYYLEGRRAGAWPSCQYRFLSYPEDCDAIDAWKGTGANQAFALEAAADGAFHLKTKCGTYLSYPGDCANTKVDTFSTAGINQAFRVSDAGDLGWSLEAVGRSGCDERFLGIPTACSTSGPDTILMQSAGEAAGWHGHPVSSPLTHSKAASAGCADPFAWSGSDGKYHLVCTGDKLPLFVSTDISHKFTDAGSLLGGSKPAWAKGGSRWAPENVEIGDGLNIATFSDGQSDGKHRVGWVLSDTGISSGGWSTYSPTSLDLGNAPGGEIDQHVFVDVDGSSYLVWKTDDNSVGDTRTRIWAQPCRLSKDGLALKGSKQVIMESDGLWWVDSWVEGGTLVEGPEIVQRGEYYYLFFASGKYCQDSYSEGVARSKSLMGPYTKLGVPLLSTSMVGTGEGGGKIVGPGHASFVKDGAGDWHAVWHASEGEDCDRHAYANKLGWTADGWPYVDFDVSSDLVFTI